MERNSKTSLEFNRALINKDVSKLLDALGDYMRERELYATEEDLAKIPQERILPFQSAKPSDGPSSDR